MKWLSKLSPKERRLLYLAVFVVSLFLIDRFILRNALNKIKTINAEIEEIGKQISNDQKYLLKEEQIKEEYQKYKTYLAPRAPINDVTELQKFITGIAEQNGFTEIKTTSGKGLPSKITSCVMSSTADMKKLTNFLYNLSDESQPVPLIIESFSLTPKEKELLTVDIYISVVSFQVAE